MKKILWMLCVALCAVSIAGCVRVAGTAAYCKSCTESGATVKSASFDTADLLPGSSAPGKITV